MSDMLVLPGDDSLEAPDRWQQGDSHARSDRRMSEHMREIKLDNMIEDSFPASDSPAYLGQGTCDAFRHYSILKKSTMFA